MTSFLAAGLGLILFASCGGGGGSTSTPTPTAPAITLSPTSQTATAGNVVAFTVAASGNPTPTYRWESSPNGSTWTPISGAVNTTYSFTCQSSQSGYQYHAIATNTAGTATSTSATLTVSTPVAPAITTQPASQTVSLGAIVTFTAAASGSPAPTFLWESSPTGSTWTAIPGATNPTYSFTCQTSQNGYRFRAKATNASGTATSDAATLTISTTPVAPAFTTQPASQTTTAGTLVAFTVNASGYPTPTFQWESSPDGSTWTSISAATSATYSFTCQASHNGTRFRVKATNTAGTATSNTVTLTVVQDLSWTVGSVVTLANLPHGTNKLINGTLTSTGTTMPSWSILGSGYQVDTSTYRSSASSAKCVDTATTDQRGLSQTVTLNQTTATPMLFWAWSKATSVTGSTDSGYSIFMDVFYTDNTHQYGVSANFPVGTTDWTQAINIFFPAKPIQSISYNLVFRNSHTGTVWFDDANLCEYTGSSYSFEDKVLTVDTSQTFSYVGSSALSLITGDGLTLALTSNGGAVSSLRSSTGAELVNSGSVFASGFFLRDVANDSSYVHPSITVSRISPTQLNLAGISLDLGLKLDATLTASSDHITVEGDLVDQAGTDRAVTLYFALPLDATGWTWGDDIRGPVTMETGLERGNYVEVPFGTTFKSQIDSTQVAGRLSRYPLASICKDEGLALAYPLGNPAQARFFVNTSGKMLVVAYDLGLSPSAKGGSASFGGAHFNFVLYRHDPSWGFRQAWSKYIALYPNDFLNRVSQGGIWIAGTSLSSIPTLSDFHVMFHELTTNQAANTLYDNQVGIKALRYNYTPSSYVMNMLPAHSNTDAAEVMADLRAGVSSTDATVRAGSVGTLASGMLDATGDYIFASINNAQTYGVRFSVNPDPDIADPDYSPNIAHFKWNDTLKATYGQTTGGVLDGEYIDSLEFKSTVLDYRASHLAASNLPLVFDSSFKPAIPEIWASYEFAKWMTSDLLGTYPSKLIMANGALSMFCFPARLFDVMGWETNWLNNNLYAPYSDSALNFRRTLSYQKPYCLLMETDFTIFTNALMKRYFQTCLFYGIYPSVFSTDGNATSAIYWGDPVLVSRDRALFQKYIPLIQSLGLAGWEPVTHVRSSVDSVAVERYGSGSSMFITLRNLSTSSQTATLTLETSSLGFGTNPTSLYDAISETSVSLSSGSSSQTCTVTLAADEVRMYQPQ